MAALWSRPYRVAVGLAIGTMMALGLSACVYTSLPGSSGETVDVSQEQTVTDMGAIVTDLSDAGRAIIDAGTRIGTMVDQSRHAIGQTFVSIGTLLDKGF